MFFWISKTLTILLNPLVWIIFGLFYGLLKKKGKRGNTWIIFSATLLLAFTNPFLTNLVLSKWESPATTKDSMPLSDVAIVLTGMSETDKSPNDQFHFNANIDRLTETLQLYRAGLISRIIISGGSGSLKDQELTESEIGAQFFASAKIGRRNIVIEKESRNTYENALYTKKTLDSLDLSDRKIVLVTSAAHMPRALKCFAKQGLEVMPYPVDFRQHTDQNLFQLFTPQTKHLDDWYVMIKEWVGTLVYMAMGYV